MLSVQTQLRHRQTSRRHHQSGVGMIEVLVTLFILAIGMLGVASLQFIGAFSNSDALNRANAVLVAQQTAERLRANSFVSASFSGLVADDRYFDPDTYNFKQLSCGSGEPGWECFCKDKPASIRDCNANTCSSAELATYDGWQLTCAATKINPSVTLDVSCNDNNLADADACSAGSAQQIMLSWPVENWKNIDRKLNPVCNPSSDAEPRDCVLLELVL